jgi:hypothetical protein
MSSRRWLAKLTIPVIVGAALPLALRLRPPTPLMTHTSQNCTTSASNGRRGATPTSSGWGTQSAPIAWLVKRQTRSPRTSTAS